MAFDQQTVVQVRQDLRTTASQFGALSAEYQDVLALPEHASLTGNVHQETKASIGASNLKNYRPAVSADVESAVTATKYSTPQSTGIQLKKELAAKPSNIFKIKNIHDQLKNVTIKASETTAREIILEGDPVNILFVNDVGETPQYRLIIDQIADHGSSPVFTQEILIDPRSDVSDFMQVGRYYVEAYHIASNTVSMRITFTPFDGYSVGDAIEDPSYVGHPHVGVVGQIPANLQVDNAELLSIINPGSQFETITTTPTWLMFNRWGRFYLIAQTPVLKNVRWSDIQPALGKRYSDFGRVGILSSVDETPSPLNGPSASETVRSLYDTFFEFIVNGWNLSTADALGFGTTDGKEWTGGTILSNSNLRIVRGSRTAATFAPIQSVDSTDVNNRFSYRPVIEIVRR